MGMKSFLKRLTSGKAKEAPKLKRPSQPLDVPETEAELALAREGYELHKVIGRGGYGRVWLAKVPGGGRRALKIVTRDGENGVALDAETRAVESVREASLHCDCLARIENVERHRDFLSYTMPLADDATGSPSLSIADYRPKTLAAEIEKRGRLPVNECAVIGKRVLGALQAMHAIPRVHGDVKPDNVLYVNGNAVLADIGLAVPDSDEAPSAGTRHYMPPETVTTPAGDLYSVAVLLYRASTGNPASSFPSITREIQGQGFLRLRRVFNIAGDPNPLARYVDTRAMTLALDWVLNGEKQLRKRRRKSLWEAITGSKPRELASPGRERFEKRVEHIIDSAKLEAASREGRTGIMTREDFDSLKENVYMAFERRIGFKPAQVQAACLMAEAVMEPSNAKRKRMIKEAAAIGGGASGMCMVIGGVGMSLGWGQGLIHTVTAFFVGGPVFGPLALLAGGLTLAAVAAHMYFSKETPAETADRAVNVLRKGVKGATEALWPDYGQYLSA